MISLSCSKTWQTRKQAAKVGVAMPELQDLWFLHGAVSVGTQKPVCCLLIGKKQACLGCCREMPDVIQRSKQQGKDKHSMQEALMLQMLFSKRAPQ